VRQVEREYVASPRTPAAARSFAKSAVGEILDGPVPVELCDDLALVISELVTNAVRAGSPTVRVALALERSRVVVRVSDEATGWPEERAAGEDDPGGRGLPLVGALSASWGVRLLGTGKVVWAELAVPSR
jgi:two-component sensor histidine kinase